MSKFRDSDRDPDEVKHAVAQIERAKPKAEKRVKEVHNGAMVAHLWAHQTQAHARVAHGNFYFHGPTIYSYGSHFPIARHIAKGKRASEFACVLFTTGSYSNTTAGHISDVKRAMIPGTFVFNVPSPSNRWGDEPNHGDNFKDYRDRFNKAVVACLAAKYDASSHLAKAEGLVVEANRYARRFGVKGRLKIPGKKLEEMKAHAKVCDDRKSQRDSKKNAKAEAARLERERQNALGREERIAEWRAGDLPSGRLRKGDFPMQALRVRGSRIETSLGVAMEIEACKPMLDALRNVPVPVVMHSLGTVGQWGEAVFVRDVIDGTDHQVHIGCHTILVSEIERIAAQLGL